MQNLFIPVAIVLSRAFEPCRRGSVDIVSCKDGVALICPILVHLALAVTHPISIKSAVILGDQTSSNNPGTYRDGGWRPKLEMLFSNFMLTRKTAIWTMLLQTAKYPLFAQILSLWARRIRKTSPISLPLAQQQCVIPACSDTVFVSPILYVWALWLGLRSMQISLLMHRWILTAQRLNLELLRLHILDLDHESVL
jgi:hypothetical protein